MYLTAAQKPASFAFALFLLVFLVQPSHSRTQVQGRLKNAAKPSGTYDLLVQVWDKPDGTGKSKLLQTIQIPKVDVVNGAFKITLDANLEGRRESDFTLKIEARVFEAWEPFRPAEVSQVKTEAVVPSLVLR